MQAPTKTRPPTITSRVDAYARSVLDGEIVAGRLVKLACTRHFRDIETGQDRGIWFDHGAADKAINFFGLIPHTKGEWAGQPLTLELWQCFIVGSIFGWKRADGTRRFRTGYTEVCRKSGKSTLAAGIGLQLAFFDKEPGSEVYSCATKRDQAKIVWGDAKQMVVKTPALRQRIRPLTSNLHMEATNSKFEPLGADEDSTDGLNIHGAIVDELHAHKTRKMWDVIETATGSRRQPLIFVITTAGSDPLSICGQQHDYAIKVLEDVIQDDTYFGYIAAIDEADSWADPSCWIKANPNLGVSVKLDDLERLAARAKEMPAAVAAFKRLRCGIWTEAETPWLDMDIYDQNNTHTIYDAHAQALPDYQGQTCYVGLDLSATTDITARVELFDCEKDPGAIDIIAHFWVPEESIAKRAKTDRVPYDVWVEQGWITPTEGNVVDYDVLREDTKAAGAIYQFEEIAYDPWNATQLATQLENDGAAVVPIRQGFGSLSEPTKALQKLILSRKFHHDGNPVLRWMFSNVVIQQDAAGNIKPSKDKSREKIDGVAATVIALARATVHTDDTSGYEEHGLLVLGEEGAHYLDDEAED